MKHSKAKMISIWQMSINQKNYYLESININKQATYIEANGLEMYDTAKVL